MEDTAFRRYSLTIAFICPIFVAAVGLAWSEDEDDGDDDDEEKNPNPNP